jgi:hypothetical protein
VKDGKVGGILYAEPRFVPEVLDLNLKRLKTGAEVAEEKSVKVVDLFWFDTVRTGKRFFAPDTSCALADLVFASDKAERLAFEEGRHYRGFRFRIVRVSHFVRTRSNPFERPIHAPRSCTGVGWP